MDEVKIYNHCPPHRFISDCKYFITSSCHKKYSYIKSDKAKIAVFNYIVKSFEHYQWVVEDWVILDDHVHLMVYSPEDSNSLPRIMNNFHRFSGNWMSKNGIIKKSEKYFHNYWDTCITYENSYFTRLNYIWMNPVKHRYVASPEMWKYGSYFNRYKEDNDKAKKNLLKYPYDNVQITDDF